MSAYATAQSERTIRPIAHGLSRVSEAVPSAADITSRAPQPEPRAVAAAQGEPSILDALIDDVAHRVAAAVTAQLIATAGHESNEWLDSRRAAEYLHVHRDTLRKLAAQRAIPAQQDGPGCKLFFRRSDLDGWRRVGGRVAGMSSRLAAA